MKQALIILTLLLPLACRQENTKVQDTSGSTSTAAVAEGTDTASATHPGSPGGTALVPEVTAGTTVLVVLEDNSIAIRGEAIPPGPAILTVENGGSTGHNLYIEGNGMNRAAGDMIEPGKTATIDVVFQPGTYTLYCPVLKHRENGEQTQVTIAAP
jgi:uncharacterized cupredoxin-like copper-binding protein